MKINNILFAVAVIAALTGCDGSSGYQYRHERSDKNYQRGMQEYRAGRIDEAIKHLSEAIKSAPGNASARFQLAVILQESKKDYLGALCNFSEYVRIAEDSDKARIALDRKVICEKLLLGNLAADNGIGIDKKTIDELQTVRKKLLTAEKRLADMTASSEKDAKRIKTLERENAQFSKMLKRLGDAEEEAAPLRPKIVVSNPQLDSDDDTAQSEAKVNAVNNHDVTENEKPLTLNPEAKALFEMEEAEGSNSSILPPASPAKEIVKVKAEPSTPSGFYKTPGLVVKPQYYTVEHGDTLMRIAKKFYGDKTAWKKIREANKTVVPMSGSVKVGDRLRLP